jgi:hypothetical protein
VAFALALALLQVLLSACDSESDQGGRIPVDLHAAGEVLPGPGDLGEHGWVAVRGDPGNAPPWDVESIPGCSEPVQRFRVDAGRRAAESTSRARVNLRRTQAPEDQFVITPDIEVRVEIFPDPDAAEKEFDPLVDYFDLLESCWAGALSSGTTSSGSASLERVEAQGESPHDGFATGYKLTFGGEDGAAILYEAYVWVHANALVLLATMGDVDGVPGGLVATIAGFIEAALTTHEKR